MRSPSASQDGRTQLTSWPTHATPEALAAGDAHIEELAQAYDAMLPGLSFGDILRWTWQQIRPQPACDCPMDPHHRWNCDLTPIWAQTIRQLKVNPWTVVSDRPRRPYVWLPFVWHGKPGTHCGIGPCCLGDGHDGGCRM